MEAYYLHLMKQWTFLVLFVILFASKAPAQTLTKLDSLLNRMANPEEPAMPTKKAVSHKGVNVYIYDMVTGYKVVSDSLTLLYVGARYPNHLVTVLIKGLDANKKCVNVRQGKWHFSGVVTSYKSKPAIIVTSGDQLSTRIQI